MQFLVKLSIVGGVSDDLLIELLDSCLALSVSLNSSVHIINKCVEVLLVLKGDLVVCSLICLEPRDDLCFIKTEGKRVILDIDP